MKESKLYRFLRPVLTGFTKIVFRPNYVGLENLPTQQGFLLAGTHTNNLDCLLLISATTRSVHFLAKDELFHGLKGLLFNHLGLIPVNRRSKDHGAVVQAERYLKQDAVIGIFPEGTTEKGRGLLPFKMGAVKMASDTKRVLVPFAIVGAYRPFHKGLTILFGKPYQVESDDLKEENEKLRKHVQTLMQKGERDGENK